MQGLAREAVRTPVESSWHRTEKLDPMQVICVHASKPDQVYDLCSVPMHASDACKMCRLHRCPRNLLYDSLAVPYWQFSYPCKSSTWCTMAFVCILSASSLRCRCTSARKHMLQLRAPWQPPRAASPAQARARRLMPGCLPRSLQASTQGKSHG